MPTVHANGIDIWYEVLQPVGQRISSDRIPLVLTHGFAGPSSHWKPEILPLAEKRPLVLYDARGHGRTSVPADPAQYSLLLFAADLAALLKAIGIHRAHIGGVSMGGMIAAQFAVDYPQMCASVLLCDTTCGNAASAVAPVAAAASALPDATPVAAAASALPGAAPVAAAASPLPDDAATDWEKRLVIGINLLAAGVRERGLTETLLREHEWKKANEPHLDESPYSLEEDLERIKLMTPEGYLGAAHAISTRPDLTERIPKITAPALVMIGEWDDFLPCALRDHELIPGSRLVVRKRCAHGSRWRLDTFLSEIDAFLDDVDANCPIAGERVV